MYISAKLNSYTFALDQKRTIVACYGLGECAQIIITWPKWQQQWDEPRQKHRFPMLSHQQAWPYIRYAISNHQTIMDLSLWPNSEMVFLIVVKPLRNLL